MKPHPMPSSPSRKPKWWRPTTRPVVRSKTGEPELPPFVSHSWPKSVGSVEAPARCRPATTQPSSENFFGSPPGCWMITSSWGWRAGDTVYELVEIPLPDGIPAGRYEVQLVFAREGGGQLPVLREGRPSGSALVLGPLTLEVEGRTLKPLQAGVDFGPLRAIAFEETLRTATPGGSVEFEVTWQATQAPGRDVTVTLTLRDATGAALVTQETPLGASYPTSLWQAGETVRVIYLLPLPALEPGLYQLSLEGVEGVETGGRLALGQVQVAGQARLYTAPPLSHPLEAQ